MAEVILNHIRKSYDNDSFTIHDFSLKIADKEFIVLVGPSGCGKSTVMVFQSYALYPHMSVYDNMAFALKLRQRINTTFIYVIHDQTEAMTLGDRAGFIGVPQMNFFDAHLELLGGRYCLNVQGERVSLPAEKLGAQFTFT